MPTFNSEQANLSNIVRAEQISKDGEHSHWVFGVEDEDGIYYDWKDTTLGASASTAEQKSAIHNFLVQNVQKQQPRPVIQIQSSDEIIGTTVGATAG